MEFPPWPPGGKCKPAAVLAPGCCPAVPHRRTVPHGAWGWGSDPVGPQDAALPGDRVRNGELPGQAVRAVCRLHQPDGEPAGEGGLHPGGVRAVSIWAPGPPRSPEPSWSRDFWAQALWGLGQLPCRLWPRFSHLENEGIEL